MSQGRTTKSILVTAVFVSVMVFVLNLLVNPWWIALWRCVQAAILFTLIFFAVDKWLLPWMKSKGLLPAGGKVQEEEGRETRAGQFVDVLAGEDRQEEQDSKP
ncbi:MAG: hypothetical protein BAA01_08310 [Bacillus thermozeamaize]|jgi:lipopolysaccharide export LptBFGC system permease protein LptF|uniref:Uncharacterized protein n=1 Tax=Bacillus thermozeamaize TaxID=230954 RepID=A0A1Y3PMV4_9BACI|nr:MAG: hypothetical protein BAA01_08310 [Bacillus thermozeamaize]